jgi:hypothetical protein
VFNTLTEAIGEQQFYMFEIDRTKNGFCSIVKYLNGMDIEKTVKDCEISHLSTWIVIKDPIQATEL